MTTLSILLGKFHALAGMLSLVAFWLAVCARKGGRLHLAAGKFFANGAYLTAVSAFFRSTSIVIAPEIFAFVPADLSPADHRTFLSGARSFHVLLAYLAMVTFVSVRHGVLVVRTRSEPETIRTGGSRALNGAMFAFGAALFGVGLLLGNLFYIVMSPIGILVGAGNLRFIARPRQTRMAWWYEHMGSMLGAGIAMHTAFLVFGLTRIVDVRLEGGSAVLPWIAPALIGTPAILWWTRYYQKKFGETAVHEV